MKRVLLTVFLVGFLAGCGEVNDKLMQDAQAGNATAMYDLALRYRQKKEALQEDLLEAEKWLEKAASAGNGQAAYTRGRDFAREGERHLETAAAGVGIAQRYMKTDFTKAVSWYQKAADLDYPPAYAALAEIYYRGWTGEADLKKAEEMAKLAKEKGVASADDLLADIVKGPSESVFGNVRGDPASRP